ncbi:MAG: GAF domain-containing protein [Myxococcales bacterium]|nr:GAF domain-containing protein [Myxococcales bacterium]
MLTDLRSDLVLDALVADLSKRADCSLAAVIVVLSRVALFRAAVGLPSEVQVSRAVSRASTPCDTVVREQRALLVDDDAGLNGSQRTLAVQYGLRSYAAVPLELGGHVVGTIAVADRRERAFDASTLDLLRDTSARARARIEELERSSLEHDEEASENELPLIESAALSRLAFARRSGALEEERFERGVALLSQLEDRHFRWQELVARLRPLAEPAPSTRSIMTPSSKLAGGGGDK